VLFVGAAVSGIIDFGAMRVDHVAADISRLLGSLAGADGAAWRLGVAAYEVVRPLSEPEHKLVGAFDQSNLLMAGLNWVDWIFCRRLHFEDPQAIIDRVDRLLARLEEIP
jgi:homoserine kinase type II